MPPTRNMNRKPMQYSIGVRSRIRPRHMVAIQLKNLTPVGMAMAIEVMAKKRLLTRPVANMW
jgi:hypothetical protein